MEASLSDTAYRRVRDKILRGEYALGSTLSRRLLAREFNMSLLPVSEALQRLEGDGLVESRPRAGTRVKAPTARDIRGHYVVREALETQSARLFAAKASPAERQEMTRAAVDLDRLYERLRKAGGDRDCIYEIHQQHMRFHMRIAECGGCEPLCEAIEKNHVLIFNWLYDVAFERRRVPPGWHAKLMESLVKGKPGAADAAMRRHVRFGMDEVLARLEPVAATGGWRVRST